jgi:aspartate--ammonia ligase
VIDFHYFEKNYIKIIMMMSSTDSDSKRSTSKKRIRDNAGDIYDSTSEEDSQESKEKTKLRHILQSCAGNIMLQRQYLISYIKRQVVEMFTEKMNLSEILAPIAVNANRGINDNLNGVEKKVTFQLPEYQVDPKVPGQYMIIRRPESESEAKAACSSSGLIPIVDDYVIRSTDRYEVIQSCAKYKKECIINWNVKEDQGVVTVMTGIRTDEDVLDDSHGNVLHQWDWEKRITCKNIQQFVDLTRDYWSNLISVQTSTLSFVEKCLNDDVDPNFVSVKMFERMKLHKLTPKIKVIHSESLLQMYPDKTPKERENLACKKYGAICLVGIGSKLSDGTIHDKRAFDYDDYSTPTYPVDQGQIYTWEEHGLHPDVKDPLQCRGLNGDIIVYSHVLKKAVELQSYGNRVTWDVMVQQAKEQGKSEDELKYPYHQMIKEHGDKYLTCGGGLGVERFIQYICGFSHIGEVSPGIWPLGYIEAFKASLSPDDAQECLFL